MDSLWQPRVTQSKAYPIKLVDRGELKDKKKKCSLVFKTNMRRKAVIKPKGKFWELEIKSNSGKANSSEVHCDSDVM